MTKNKINIKRIEVEFRARFNKLKFNQLKQFLDRKAEKLGRDDKDVYFFTLKDKLIKVVNNITKKSGQIVLKLRRIGKGSDFEEIEIPVAQEYLDKTVELFRKLDVADMSIHSFQKRFNYIYKGVDLALKYSSEWQYHLELEILINNLKDKKEAEEKIKSVAKELGVKIMTEKELKELVKRVENKYKNKKS